MMSSWSLVLQSFRCWALGRWTFPMGITAITGDNGRGKTSILEALSLFSPGRGLKGACFSELQKKDQEAPWRVRLEVDHHTGPLTLETGLYEQQRRKIYANHVALKSQSLSSEWITLIWPLMGLFESMTQRRSWLNRLVFSLSPSYGQWLTQYDKALRQRQFLLQQGERNTLWYESLERILAEKGLGLLYMRQEALEILSRQLAHHHTPFPVPSFVLQGGVEEAVSQGAGLDAYIKKLEKDRVMDGIKKTTQWGPHKVKFLLYHPHGLELDLCSMGEQKGLIFSVALAVVRACLDQKTAFSQAALFLLMDEAMAHLDMEKQEWLWQELRQLEVISVITGLPQMYVPPFVHHLAV